MPTVVVASGDPLYAMPSSVEQTTAETIVWGCDVSAQTGGATPSSVLASQLWDLTTNVAVSLTDASSLSGTVISQIVRGSALTAGHQYRLAFEYDYGSNTVTVAVIMETPW